MLLCTCKPWRVLLFVAVAGDTHAYSNFSQTKLYVSTAILLQSDVLCDGRHWNECLTRATWLQSWCCWLRRSPYQKVEFMVTIALLTFLTLHFFFMLNWSLGSFWQRKRASYKLHRLHRYRSWQDLRKWNLQQQPGRLRGAFLAPWLGNAVVFLSCNKWHWIFWKLRPAIWL